MRVPSAFTGLPLRWAAAPVDLGDYIEVERIHRRHLLTSTEWFGLYLPNTLSSFSGG